MTIAEILENLRKEAAEAGERMRAILEAAQTDNKRSLTDEETVEFDGLVAAAEARDARIAQLEREVAREDDAAKRAEALAQSSRTHGTAARVIKEDGPYTATSSRNKGNSYFRDLWKAKRGDRDAIERLVRNNAHVEQYSERVGISTVTGAGGEFVPPLWLENEFVPLARAGRVTADLCTKDDLPTGTDSINIPKVSAGTAVAEQGYPSGGQNAAVQETDLTTTSVSSGVFTVAGGQTVSMQLIEQSPLNIDKVVLMDLAKAYAIQIDNFVIAGTGTNQVTGLLNVSGVNAVTYTDTTPSLVGTTGTTSKNLYAAIAQGVSKIVRQRFDRPTAIVMHPELWYWALTQADTTNRPVVLENQNGLFNAAGSDDGVAFQGHAGTILGLPVYVDANVPTNLGAGTNQTPVIISKFDDQWLWEGAIKAEAFEQTYANNLSLFVRLYGYHAFQGARYPQSTSVILGTGMIAPSGF